VHPLAVTVVQFAEGRLAARGHLAHELFVGQGLVWLVVLQIVNGEKR
jgi:hypothetical protein